MRILIGFGLLLVLSSVPGEAASAEYKTVSAPDNVKISTARWGNRDGKSIVFVHGWSQAGASWKLQTSGSLAKTYDLVTFDLRGHGFSGKPAGLAAYTKPGVWGDDLAVVIKALGLERPVLVGWSYGTEVVREYLIGYGDGGVVLVAGPASPKDFGPGIVAVLPQMLSMDYSANLAATMQFLGNAFFEPPGAELFAEAVGINMSAAIVARLGVVKRTRPPHPQELGKTTVPFLIVHGKEDKIILPTGAAGLATFIPDAKVKLYDGVGHLPFVEASERFDSDLASFVESLK